MFKKVLLPINIKQFDGAVNLDVVKKFLTDNKDKDEVKVYLSGLNPITVDGVQKFLRESADGKSWLDSEKDKHSGKSLETWKANNLQKLIDDEVAKQNPSKSPEQIKIEELTKKIEDAEKARNRESLVNKALKVAKEKNLPDGIIDFFIAEDEDGTTANLSKLEEEYNKAVKAAVDEKFKENGRQIDNSSGGFGGGAIDIDSLASEISIRK
ncbi:DUF4355 domain-containing protein [Cytobacillus horneckiae]|uniref:DUF4355 domain-containing protein n=1 Tax=Cytobacillus horneckiae TaxID=549687 RepID=UPI003D9A9F27